MRLQKRLPWSYPLRHLSEVHLPVSVSSNECLECRELLTGTLAKCGQNIAEIGYVVVVVVGGGGGGGGGGDN